MAVGTSELLGEFVDAGRQENSGTDVPGHDFMQLLLQSERPLRVYVLSLMPHWADAEDVLQETKLQLWDRFAEYDASGSFLAWARKIAFYLVLDHRKKVSRERVRFSQTALELVAESAAAFQQESDARHRALAECLAKLSLANRALLRQCYGAGRTIKQVAESLGRSIRATQQKVAKIRVILQDCVERTMRQEEHP
jgi:RNA polymerase sigma-70 factor (ECF subfamily)